MGNLRILNINEKQTEKRQEEFLNDIVVKGKLIKNIKMEMLEDEGLQLIELTLPYIENIYRNPNRLIVNQEEIVNVELAKKITVESVKHLSKHTNFIQKIDEKGEVEPSKILNIEKEESYDTYENRLIYSLIKNIKLYVNDKKEFLEKISNNKDGCNDKKLEYNASVNIDGKEVNLINKFESKYTEEGLSNKVKQEKAKIKEIETKVDILTNFSVYKQYDKKHARLVTSPIKKTNLIMKNVNFQYAVKLWDYLQENLFTDGDEPEEKIELKNDLPIKKIIDEIFYLQYIALNSKDEEDEEKQEKTKEAKKELLANVLEYTDLSNKEIEKILLNKTKKDGFKDEYIEKEIRKIFSEYISISLKQMDNVKVKK